MRKFLLSMLTFVLLILGTTPVFAGTITNKSTGYEAVLDDQADQACGPFIHDPA